MLAALHREGGALRIALRGLTDVDLLALLERIAGHEMTDDGVALRDALLAETAGNPFFVGEILRHLAETGAISQDDDGRWVADPDLRAAGLPVSVREVIGRRLATLGPDTERVLALGAVIGRDFDIALLAAVAQMDEDPLIDLCDAAVTAAVLATTDRPDRYTFAHALIEHTLYDSLSPARRARAHRAVAEAHRNAARRRPWRTRRRTRVSLGAAVQPTDTAKAIHYAQTRRRPRARPARAGRSAPLVLAKRSNSSTALHIPIPTNGPNCSSVWATRNANAGSPPTAKPCSTPPASPTNTTTSTSSYGPCSPTTAGYSSVMGGVDHERIAAIDRALERVGDQPSADRARLLALAATERMFLVDLPDRLVLAEQAVAVARASGDRAALAWALQRPFISIDHPSTLGVRTGWIDEACEIADDLGEPAMQYWAHNHAVIAAVERADGAAHRRTPPPRRSARSTHTARDHPLDPHLPSGLDRGTPRRSR